MELAQPLLLAALLDLTGTDTQLYRGLGGSSKKLFIRVTNEFELASVTSTKNR